MMREKKGLMTQKSIIGKNKASDFEKKILAGIVTFNPEIQRLQENLTSLLSQTSEVLIIDNGSQNYDEFISVVDKRIVVLRNKKNEGIASALCSIMEYAKKKSYKWVLTLDQDSIIQPELLNKYSFFSKKKKYSDVAMFTCLIKDRNFNDDKNEKQSMAVKEVPYCITSAAYTNVEKYFKTSGYDKDFFIDAVDFDICYALREKGYRICRINYFGLLHEVGHGENRRFLWKKIVVYHQSPFRIFCFARNMVRMSTKHKQLFPWYVMIRKEVALFTRILLYEDQKKQKMSAFFRGIREA